MRRKDAKMKFKSCSLGLGLLGLLFITAAGPSNQVYDISKYGALGDGHTLNTPAIQALIDRIAASGGGTLDVPEGKFLTGALFFKQGVNLHVEEKGVLLASTNPSDYPQINTRWEGVERRWTSAFLNFDHMNNVVVDGTGMIDGQGDIWMTRGFGGRRGRFGAGTRPTGAGGNLATTMPSTNPIARNIIGRPRMICFSNCDGVRIADLHLQKQAVWCLHILYSQNVEADNLNIRAVARIPSSDGIDVDSSKDVHISHCDIACNDDDIAIKSGKDADGLRVNRPSEDITISDCTIGVGGGITMGSEVSGGVRNVVVERCVYNGTDAAARFKSQPSRGGFVENITFRDITLNNVWQAFEFNDEWRMVPPILPPAKTLTVMRDIHLENFTGTARTGGIIHGLKDGPITDVSFTNCNFTAGTGLRMDNALRIDTSGLHMQVQNGPMIVTPTTQETN
jgi:polygalacturonase